MSNYIEEKNVGLGLQPAAFCPANKTFFAISGRHVISYDVETGIRLQLFAHLESVIGAHFVNKKFITITKSGTVVSWDWKNGKELHRTNASDEFCFHWSYEVTLAGSETPDIIVYVQSIMKCDEPMQVDESSSDNSICHAAKASLLQLNLIDADESQFRVTLTSLVDVTDVIPSRRHLAVGGNFIAVVRGCDLKIIPLAHFRGKINGPLVFNHQIKFNVPDAREVAFCEVHAHDDAVFAAVNVGRMYFWSQIRECGLHQNNKTYVDASNCRFVMAVAGCGQSVFTGDGTSTIARWNLLSTGVGRLRHGEYLRMAAPVERLHLSASAALLLAVLADNSLHVIRTASLTIQCQAEGVRWNEVASPLDWARLTVDPSLQQVVTNGRLGHVQWIDFFKWKTMGEFDVSEENTPPRDHFAAPNYLWSNVYLVHLTTKRLITCERRRNGFDKTDMKIYRRMQEKTTTDFRLEECVVCPQRVSFVCSSVDEAIGVQPAAAATSSSSQTPQKESEGGQEEIVRILEDGQIDVFVPDPFRIERWRIDPNRQRVTWRKSAVRACSRVYSSVFATINEAPVSRANKKLDLNSSRRSSRLDSSLHSSIDDEEQRDDELNGRRTHVLLWQLPVTLRIFQMIDCIADAVQVEWAPSNQECTTPLLVAGSQGIFGYNPKTASLVWRVERPCLSLFASQLTCFAYDSNFVIFFDSTSGKLKKVLKFANPQEQIVGCGFNQKNIVIIGLSRNGICVLKTKKAQNQAQSIVQLPTKKTPFSQLVAKNAVVENGLPNGESSYVQLEMKIPAASKIFDGPAHTLAPIAQLAPLYIRSCLAVRRKD